MRQINWEDVQKDLESGLYFKSEVCKKYNIYYKLIRYAEEHNLLNSKLYNINTKMKEDTKIKISKGIKKYLIENPDKHIWRSNNKFKSIPCEIFKNILKEYNILFYEEVLISKEKMYSVDILLPEYTTIIEINGNQHYNSDGTLKEYYQVRHNYIKNLGWNIIELHYSLVYNKDIYKNIIEKIKNGKSIDLPFYIKNKKNKKYKNQKDYFNKMNEMYYKIQEPNIELILNSNIDFSKFGWVTKVALLLNKPPQKVNIWMKKYMPDFYNEKCFKKTKKK